MTPINRMSPERFAMLYEEIGERRGDGAGSARRPRSRAPKPPGGGQGRIVRTVSEMVNSRDEILDCIKPTGEWNEDVLIVYNNRMWHAVNGYLAFDATDSDPLSIRTGLLGWQFHKGPPTTVQFKDVVIKPLTAMPNVASRFITKPSPAPEPRKTYKGFDAGQHRRQNRSRIEPRRQRYLQRLALLWALKTRSPGDRYTSRRLGSLVSEGRTCFEERKLRAPWRAAFPS